MASEWRTFTLGEICDFRAGSVFKPALKGKASGDFPFVKVSDMNLPANAVRIQVANNWVSCEDVTELKARPLPPGTVIFAKIGEALRQNRLRQLTRDTLIDNNMMGAIPSEDKVDPHYFYYALSQFDFADIAQGTALPYLTVAALSTLTLDVPPISEQRAIAHILGTLDDKIELNRKQNETLEAMARALFKAWFVDFEPVRAKMEGRWQRGQSLPGLPAHLYDLFPDRLVESELGEIPEGWEVKSFADTVEIIGGGTPKTSVAEYWGGDIPWFSVVDAPPAPDVWVLDTEKKITHAGVENSSTRILPVGTTIISARGTVGRLALVGVPMAMNQSCYGLRGKLGHRGFFNYFTTRQLVSTLQHRTHGSVFDTITRDTLAGAQVVAPPLAVVETFERLVAPALDRIREALFESRSLATTRNTLLPKLISGELRVPDVDKFMEAMA